MPVLFLSVIILFSFNKTNAQTIDSSAYSNDTFINKSVNVISNDSAIYGFYHKLYMLQRRKKGLFDSGVNPKKTERLTIVQIGDSHIQADFFSGMIRQKLQLQFGNAGRGLVFPYRVARSNEPSTYHTSSMTDWSYKRNVFYKDPAPIGISGYMIETDDSTATIDLVVKDQPGLNYSFTKFTLFHDKQPADYDISVCDSTKCERAQFKSDDGSNPFVSKMSFATPQREVILHNKKAADTGKHTTRIYGMLLQNDSSGVEFDMIGVNGAEYRHFSMSKYFIRQLSYLHPDLIIVSLGTNEAYAKDFDSAVFDRDVDTFISKLNTVAPGVPVMLTTPGDSFRKKGRKLVKNPDMKLAELTEIDYCRKHNMSWWDWYEIMGGFGSMNNWFALRLTAKDKVHFSVGGYKIQGDLFYTALMKGYINYLSTAKP
jgi:hypothetical protein